MGLVSLAGQGNPQWKCWGGDWQHAVTLFRERCARSAGALHVVALYVVALSLLPAGVALYYVVALSLLPPRLLLEAASLLPEHPLLSPRRIWLCVVFAGWS